MVVCVRIASGSEVVTEVQTFNTTTASLVSLADWLASNGCTHVAMEATGVYWKPIWHILSDSEFTLVLAMPLKNDPNDHHLDQSDEEILTSDVSDEALEVAAGMCAQRKKSRTAIDRHRSRRPSAPVDEG